MKIITKQMVISHENNISNQIEVYINSKFNTKNKID